VHTAGAQKAIFVTGLCLIQSYCMYARLTSQYRSTSGNLLLLLRFFFLIILIILFFGSNGSISASAASAAHFTHANGGITMT
jgi:cell division protein FtsX